MLFRSHPRVMAEEGLRRVYSDIEVPVREVLFKMERTGVLIDAAQLDAQSHELGKRMLELEAMAHREAGQPFNLNSPKQIGEIFFERLKLPVVKKTASGAASTDEEVLEKLALDYPLPKTLLEYRGIAKLKSTYTDKLPKMVNARTGRVHTTYGQATAVTGRLASNDPNLQNIPVRTAEGRRIREAFVAPKGAVIFNAPAGPDQRRGWAGARFALLSSGMSRLLAALNSCSAACPSLEGSASSYAVPSSRVQTMH